MKNEKTPRKPVPATGISLITFYETKMEQINNKYTNPGKLIGACDMRQLQGLGKIIASLKSHQKAGDMMDKLIIIGPKGE